jgi:hypothetical protein
LRAARRSADHRGMRPRAPSLDLRWTLGAAALLTALAARPAAATEFLYRGLTLPRGEVALDLGLGYGHAPIDANESISGFGMNLEIAGGITSELELVLRTGVRFDDDGQATQADSYGRPFETETYDAGFDRVANPELKLRWSVARGSVAQLGLEGRFYLPFAAGSRAGFLFGLPVALRLASVRIDTGLYVPILFYDPTQTSVSVPVHIWIQASPTFWLGPLLGLRFDNPGGHTEYPVGFGLGSSLSHAVDLRAWFLFPDLNRDEGARTFGAGVGLEIRFE